MTLTATRAASRCTKPSGEFCRIHNPAPAARFESVDDVFAAVDQRHAPAVAVRPSAGLKLGIELDAQAYVTETAQGGKWQGVWVKAADGTPALYAKVRVGQSLNGKGEVLHEGVYLCDIEVNPALKGKNVPLGALRVLKAHYGVGHIWVGDTYSASGFRMVNRLLAHEAETGEKLVAFQPHVDPAHVWPAPDDYEFVKDWAKMQPKYRL